MLSLTELRRAARVASSLLADARLKRVDQPEPCALVFTFETDGGKRHLFVSCRPEYARLCMVEAGEPAALATTAATGGSFQQYLRAHQTGSRLRGIETTAGDDFDRRATLALESREGGCKIVFSIMGPRSNIYLLGGDGKLLHALRPLEDTRKELAIGEVWTPPRSAPPSEGEDRWAGIPDAEYLKAIANSYRSLEQRGDADELARRILQAVKKEHAFLERKRVHLQEDLDKARQAETDLRRGELLKIVLHAVKHGDT
ncbi:MAG: NFACT family protein, partial [Acidobacteriota bacterium]|nr:NFACT family protein [Acidobacteriota bacterium]